MLPAPNVSLCVLAQVPGGVKRLGKTSVFNGLIGMLERGEIDLAVTDLSLTYLRAQVRVRPSLMSLYIVYYFLFSNTKIFIYMKVRLPKKRLPN